MIPLTPPFTHTTRDRPVRSFRSYSPGPSSLASLPGIERQLLTARVKYERQSITSDTFQSIDRRSERNGKMWKRRYLRRIEYATSMEVAECING